ncbi:MAG: hypothetical protein EAX95_03925 [Candidatus Thorarchaeota archaeon]|nr:hypothetical protein [Candidatus Thorarchaeota archaeon]
MVDLTRRDWIAISIILAAGILVLLRNAIIAQIIPLLDPVSFDWIDGMDQENTLEYLTYAPNAYRIHAIFMVFIFNAGLSNFLSIYDTAVLLGIPAVLGIYFLARPEEKDYRRLLRALFFCTVVVVLPNYIAFMVLAIVIRYSDRRESVLLLIPLVLFREVLAFVALGYFFFADKHRKEAIISFGFAAATYLVFRFLVIGNVGYPPGHAPFVTLAYSFIVLIENPLYALYATALFMPMVIFLYKNTQSDLDTKMLLWTAGPNFAFALFFEPQLWLPVIIASTIHRQFLWKERRSEAAETATYDIEPSHCGEDKTSTN